MMRITDTFRIKGRGRVVCTESDGPCPQNGSELRRTSDGAVWRVDGVERYNARMGTVGEAGEPIGILLHGDAEPAVGDELTRVDERPLAPPNIYKDSIRIAHASLAKLSEESDFKARCPVCPKGILLVHRNQVTLGLMREDRCISCGQRFTYTDESIGGEALEAEQSR